MCLVFGSETEQGIFEQVLKGELDFVSEPWPSISESAKDLIRRMLIRDPKKRLTAHEVLCEYACLIDATWFNLKMHLGKICTFFVTRDLKSSMQAAGFSFFNNFIFMMTDNMVSCYLLL